MSDTLRYFEEEYEVKLPTRKVVCWRCRGEGTHTNPAIDGNGITASEMDELGDDFREDYLSGVYDIPCEECHGANVLDEVDEDRCPADLLAKWRQWLKEEALYRAEVAAERRMGA